MAPFGHDHCPVCDKTTTQRWLPEDSDPHADRISAICEECTTVLVYDDSGLVGQRPATDEERKLIPAAPDLDSAAWARMRREWDEGKTGLRDWIDGGCPGLTPEIEASLPPGTRERLRRFVEGGQTPDPR